MDMNKLKQNNSIQQITQETVETLTEPIQPQYLLLTLEQYNAVARYFGAVGSNIAEITDSISYLPTQEGVNELVVRTLRPSLREMQQAAKEKMDSTKYSVEDRLSKQTESLTKLIDMKINRMMGELEARDLTPWKIRLKWASIGAILPLMGCILLLILR